MTDKGRLVSVDGWVLSDESLTEGDWISDPADMAPAEDMFCLKGVIRGEAEEDWMEYYIFLRPWGVDWENIRDMEIDNAPYYDMMPMSYEDWYLPRIQRGETKAPDTFDAEPAAEQSILDYQNEGAIFFTYPGDVFRFDGEFGFCKLKNEDNSLIAKFDGLKTAGDVSGTIGSYDSNYGKLEDYEKQELVIGTYPATMIAYRESGDYCMKLCIDLNGESGVYAGMEITVYATDSWDQLTDDTLMDTILSLRVEK